MRKDQWNVTVRVAGRNLGTFDVKTGGETDTDELTYKPGGMAPQVSLGGIPKIGQLIVHRMYTLERDQAVGHWLLTQVGRGHTVVQQQPLDPDKNAYGKPFTYDGVLKRVTLPEVDSNATEAALIELEVTINGGVT
jgi:hypothetical protein